MTLTIRGRRTIRKYAWTGVIIVAFVMFIVAFFYLDRRNEISVIIQESGPVGVAFAILLMAALCTTPIPSEGLLVMYLKIFGIYEGIFLAWLGSTLSAVAIFVIVRVYGHMFIKKLISPQRFEVVDRWVKGKGALGLLIARLLPIPAFVVNYIASAMPSMKFWTYLWTAALSMIPYYLGTALVFLGVAQETWIWLILGSIALILIWITGYFLNKRRVI